MVLLLRITTQPSLLPKIFRLKFHFDLRKERPKLKKSLYSLCALILIPSAALATPVPILNAGASVSTRNGSTTTFQCVNSQSNSGPVASFDCGALALNPAVGAGTGESQATATFGSLSSYATLIAGGGPASNAARVHADASAYFDDFLMAFRPINGVNTAFTGSFVVDAAISGNATLGGSNGTALGNLQLTVGSQTCSQQIDDLSAQAMFCHIVVPFVANQNIELFLHLSATVDFFVPTSSTALRVTADFSHTATITGITVLDANGDPVNDAIIVAGSRATYPGAAADPTPTTVPEPGTVGLLGAGLALMAWKAMRGRAV